VQFYTIQRQIKRNGGSNNYCYLDETNILNRHTVKFKPKSRGA
jgi:hypothetical protein